MGTPSFAIRDIVNEDGAASISDYGAHVLRWAPSGMPDVVWKPRTIYLQEGKAIRGGVPIIFPWFNSGYDPTLAEAGEDTPAKKPKHGFGRTRFWTPDPASSDDAHVRYTMDSSEIDPSILAQFVGNPEPRFHATYDVTVGDSLSMALTVTNDGDEPFSYEAALHTYLHVGDVARAQVLGLDGAEYLDTTLPGFPVRVQDGPIGFDGSMVDRIYLTGDSADDASAGDDRGNDDGLRVRDDALDRTIRVATPGAKAVVVWNPGEEAGNAIGDLEDGEWRGFVCVEAAANRDRLITLSPGESHTLGQVLSVEE
ncbi:D-hexose-6-phosphate mutarotase [Bifidobacterium sp. MA2]|uniref:Putative glucose-6-phosphate 1-epimerase n=1 Tax=Bifidobacterium santillanense TaxID=2809028 RepID=A0ABS5ULM4_9BIFI|nr:D-hexose-6-phosphate mutarotase [Bifidobacterium santillanense]MBT1171807.1 D-hexose-6-phosphate mutarotase [Bifidobacterium santillanense]